MKTADFIGLSLLGLALCTFSSLGLSTHKPIVKTDFVVIRENIMAELFNNTEFFIFISEKKAKKIAIQLEEILAHYENQLEYNCENFLKSAAKGRHLRKPRLSVFTAFALLSRFLLQ